MKKLYIYDTYRKVVDENNTFLYAPSSFTELEGEYNSMDDLVLRAKIIYNEFKSFGTVTLDNSSLSAEGKYTVEIMTPTGRRIQRIIFAV